MRSRVWEQFKSEFSGPSNGRPDLLVRRLGISFAILCFCIGYGLLLWFKGPGTLITTGVIFGFVFVLALMVFASYFIVKK